MPAFVIWISRVISLLWRPFFGVIAGFFVWLARIIKDFFTRNIRDLSWRRSVFNSAAFTGAITFYVGTVIVVTGMFIKTLLDAYSKVRGVLSSLISQTGVGGGGGSGGGYDPLGLFNQLANSVGLYRALYDTFAIWSPFFIALFTVIISYIQYKIIINVHKRAKDFIFYSKSSK